MKYVRFLSAFVLTLALSGPAAIAQTFRGDLAGTVTDPSGAALPNTVIKVDNPSTGLSRSTVTGGNGDFIIAELPVGTYELTVTVPGFEVRKITGIEIAVAKTTNVPVQLGIARQQSQVEVTADAVAIETTSSALVALVD